MRVSISYCETIIVADEWSEILSSHTRSTCLNITKPDGNIVVAFQNDGRFQLFSPVREAGCILHRMFKRLLGDIPPVVSRIGMIGNLNKQDNGVIISLYDQTLSINDDYNLIWTGNQSSDLEEVKTCIKHFAKLEVMA